MRKQPKLSTPPKVDPLAKTQENEVITQIRKYELITPLFGGGVTAGEIDPVTPIRGSEIRGQLRFWWRACRGGQFGDNPQKMKEEEDKLWGKAYNKGEEAVKQEQVVQLSVKVLQLGEIKKPFTIERNPRTGNNQPRLVIDVPPYGAFSFQPSKEELQGHQVYTKTVLTKATFIVTISFPKEKQDDIKAALWAWETFGGIGARTRRGFGAIRCLSIRQDEEQLSVNLPLAFPENVRQWLQEHIDNYVIGEIWPVNVPHLPKKLVNAENIKVVSNGREDVGVWKSLIGRLRSFRQMRKGGTQGRSEWPEPSAIRHLTECNDPNNQPIPNPRMDKFPRAAFGLPIVFHFKDRGEPRDTSLELEQKGQERFASPLILKPLACTQNSDIGLAIVLQGTYFDEQSLVLKYVKPSVKVDNVSASLDSTRKLTLPNNVQISRQMNALQAFMKYL